MSRSIRETADRFMRCWTRADGQFDPSLISEDIRIIYENSELNGIDDVKSFHETCPRFDAAWRIFEHERTAAVLYRTHFPGLDGAPAWAEGIDLLEFDPSGKICRIRAYVDSRPFTEILDTANDQAAANRAAQTSRK